MPYGRLALSATGCCPLILLALTACADSASVPPDVRSTKRDSADVTIIESSATVLAGLPRWSTTETLSLGGRTATEAEEFFRISDVKFVGDEVLAVVSVGTHDVRFFGLDGAFLGSQGRDGDGPAEFRLPVRLFPMEGDSIAVYDLMLRRLTVISPNFKIQRTARLDDSAVNPSPWGMAGGRALIVDEVEITMPADRGPTTSNTRLFSFDLSGARQSFIGTFPARRLARTDRGLTDLLLSPSITFAVVDSGVWVGTGERARIEQYDLKGGLMRVAMWSESGSREVTKGIEGAMRAHRLSSATSEADSVRIRASFEGMVFGKEVPAYERILASSNGTVWIKAFTPPYEVADAEWLVLHPDGSALAQVGLPWSFRLYDVRGRRLAGTQLDLGIERVVVYELDSGALAG